jgi:dTDP-4-amino-4,6-dideoxygalactose transaminase
MSSISTNKLENRVAELTLRSESVAVGRAAFGLFALLKIWKEENKIQKIALPSLLCQSPLAATLLAGWEPEFCDVDPETGNVSDAEWRRVVDSGVHAVLFVHLFGNVGDAGRIADVCRFKGIYFIEDAAQSFGGTWGTQPCGSFGDASIVSFGHTKLVDVGHGGMVLSNDSKLANAIRIFSEGYSMSVGDTSIIAKQFRELFYAARHKLGSNSEVARETFKGLLHIYQPLIMSRWNPDVSEKILAKLDHINSAVLARREKNNLYKDLMHETKFVPIKMSQGSVPWRAVFRLPGIDWAKQDVISEAVRKEGVDISNWYIPSHWMIVNKTDPPPLLKSTELLSREIFQLWLDDRTEINCIRRNVLIITKVLNEVIYEQ